MSQSKQAPAPLRAIAWLSIIMGVLMALGSLMGLLTSASLGDLRELQSLVQTTLSSSGLELSPDDMQSLAPALQTVFTVLRYLWLLSLAHLAIAVVVLWSGIDLLRLRPWARTANEVYCWLTLAVLALYAVYWVWLWLAVPAPSLPDVADFNPAMIRTLETVVLVIIEAVFVVPTVIVLRYLRGPQVRAAVAGR